MDHSPARSSSERAAAYVRMSTEHQQYSLDNQLAVIQSYAAAHDLSVITTYSDPGRSGLNVRGRAGLRRLLADVHADDRPYSVLLVYDVSRWGRFQDLDESAHYEFLLKAAGVRVAYCAEPFENDGAPLSAILKNIKRAMAGEYSRELSVKVTQGQARLAAKGYRQGGVSCFGLRRMLVDSEGNPKGLLRPGEWKSIATDRVVQVPGPKRETQMVERIFRDFVEERAPLAAIARRLNENGVMRADGRPWTPGTVRYVLTNEGYIGNAVFGRTSVPLRGAAIEHPPDRWIRVAGLYPPIIEPRLFEQAGAILAAKRWLGATDEQLLDGLRALLRERGRLTATLVDASPLTATASTYEARFGGLRQAYVLIGYRETTFDPRLECKERLKDLRAKLFEHVRSEFEKRGAAVEQPEPGLFLINGKIRIDVVGAHKSKTPNGYARWRIPTRHPRPDHMVVARFDLTNSFIRDYYILPRRFIRGAYINLRIENPSLERFRHETIEALFGIDLESGRSSRSQSGETAGVGEPFHSTRQ